VSAAIAVRRNSSRDLRALAISHVRAVPGGVANNFDALRFWAALAVLWSHAFPLTRGSDEHEPLFALSAGQTTFGEIAVTFFFVISGYLITRSYERSSDAWSFVKARVLRIMPALLMVLFAEAFLLGPLVSAWKARDYLHSWDSYRFVFSQASFLQFYDELPGVFTHNPMRWVNGSLWTLRYEVECYVLVLLLGVAGLLKRHVTLLLYCSGLVFVVLEESQSVSGAVSFAAQNHHVGLATKFLAGALAYQWKVPLRAWGAWLAFAVSAACLTWGGFHIAEDTVLPYLVMYLALGTALRLPSLIRFGDLSYGIYIYAWPVSQVIVSYSANPQWWQVGVLATPLVLSLAALSWHGVEKVALAWKARRFAV
jgi:peptidoglycan/LPS O-acetylase OafA/YrhL